MKRTSRIRAKWTDQIPDEAFRNLDARRPGISDRLPRIRELLNRAVPDALVTDYEPPTEGLKLPDPDDRHVLAAAIKAGAQIIVTANVKDFPKESLYPSALEAKTPDEFVLDQIDIDDRNVWACVQEIADTRNNPPETVDDVLDALERAGLVEAVAALRAP